MSRSNPFRSWGSPGPLRGFEGQGRTTTGPRETTLGGQGWSASPGLLPPPSVLAEEESGGSGVGTLGTQNNEFVFRGDNGVTWY